MVKSKSEYNKKKWKVFFVISIIPLLAFNGPLELYEKYEFRFVIISLIQNMVLLLCIYGYSFSKRFLTYSVWRVLFPVTLMWEVIFLYLFRRFLIVNLLSSNLAVKDYLITYYEATIFAFISLLFIVLAFKAMYNYAFVN